jgi:drug/metabolite transporter (DMT)-like permease
MDTGNESMDGTGLKRNHAVLLLVSSALLWSTSGLLVKLIDWNPVAISGTRSAISSVVMVIFLRRLHFTWSFAQIGGALAHAGTVILFVTATKLTTAANAILLQYTAPIYVALFSACFLGERVTRLDWLIIGLVLFGMLLFFMDKLTGRGLLGNLCAITSGVTFGWFTLFMRKQKRESPLETVLLGNVFAALIGLLFMFDSMPSRLSCLGLLVMGVFQFSIPYILYSLAIKYVTALDAILFPAFETILNPIWVLFIIGEAPGPWAILGGSIVLASITSRGFIVTRKLNAVHARE